jgi:extracellular matrix regulatory protein A
MSDALRLLNVGFGNVVVARRVIAVVTPTSAPIKRLKEEARVLGKLVDATQGKKTRAIVVTDSDHIVLSAIQAETISQRLRVALGGATENKTKGDGA